jgi:hypothetical protein
MKQNPMGIFGRLGRMALCAVLATSGIQVSGTQAQTSAASGPMAAQMQDAVAQYEHNYKSLYSSGLRMRLRDLLVTPATEIDALDRDLRRAAASCSVATYDRLWQERNMRISTQVSAAFSGWEQLEGHIEKAREDWKDSFISLQRAIAQIPALSETFSQEFFDNAGALSPYGDLARVFGVEPDEVDSIPGVNRQLREKLNNRFREGLDAMIEALPGQENALLRGIYDTFHQQSFSRLVEAQEGATPEEKRMAAYLVDEQQRFLRDYDGDLADFDKRLEADIQALYRVFKAAQDVYERNALSPVLFPFSCAQPENYCPIDYEWLGRSHYESLQAKMRSKFDVGQPYELTAHADRLDGYLDQSVREEGRRMAELLTGLIANGGGDETSPLGVSRERREANPDDTDLLVPDGLGAKSEDVRQLVSRILELPAREQERVLGYFQALADETATVRRAIYEERVEDGTADPIAAFEAGEIGPVAALRAVREKARRALTEAGVPEQPEINLSDTGNDEFGVNSGDILAGLIGGVRSYETLNDEIRAELQARALAEEALRREVQLYGGVRTHAFNTRTANGKDVTLPISQSNHDNAIAPYLERPEWMEAAYAELSAETMRKRREGRAWLESAIPGVLPNQSNVPPQNEGASVSATNDDADPDASRHGGIGLSEPATSEEVPVAREFTTPEIVVPSFEVPSFDPPSFPNGGIAPSAEQGIGQGEDIFTSPFGTSSAAPAKEVLEDIFSSVFPPEGEGRVRPDLDQLTASFAADLHAERGRLDEIRAEARRDAEALDDDGKHTLVGTLVDSVLDHQKRVRAIGKALEVASNEIDTDIGPDLGDLLIEPPAETCEPPSDFDVALRSYYAALNAFKSRHEAPVYDRRELDIENLTSSEFAQLMATKDQVCRTYRGDSLVRSCSYRLVYPSPSLGSSDGDTALRRPERDEARVLKIAGDETASLWISESNRPRNILQVQLPSGAVPVVGEFHAEARAVENAFEVLQESARPKDGFVFLADPLAVREEVAANFRAAYRSHQTFRRAHTELRWRSRGAPAEDFTMGLSKEGPINVHPQDLLEQMQAGDAVPVALTHSANGVDFPYDAAYFDGYALLARGSLTDELVSSIWARNPVNGAKPQIASQLLGKTYWLFCDTAEESIAQMSCEILVPMVDVWTMNEGGENEDVFRVEATELLKATLVFGAFLDGAK